MSCTCQGPEHVEPSICPTRPPIIRPPANWDNLPSYPMRQRTTAPVKKGIKPVSRVQCPGARHHTGATCNPTCKRIPSVYHEVGGQHQARAQARQSKQPVKKPCSRQSCTAHGGTNENLVKCVARGATAVAGQIIDGTAVAVGQTRLRMERVRTKYTKGQQHTVYLQEDDNAIIVNRAEFQIVKWFMLFFLMLIPLLVLLWLWYFRDGFAWFSDHVRQFNYHPLLMVTSTISLSGFSMLSYRNFRCCRRLHLKIWHFLLHAASMTVAYGGLHAAQAWHNRASPPVPHYYSLHSWIGMVALFIFVGQLAGGFVVFLVLLLCEGATAKCRAQLIPVHTTIGHIAYLMAVSACIQGINEKCIENFAWRYPEWPPEAFLMNLIGVLIVVAGLLMTYLLLRTDFRYCGRIQIMFNQNPFEILVQYV